jgi:hypothetical protein
MSLAGLLQATVVASEAGLRDQVVAFPREHAEEPQASLVSVLRAAEPLTPADRVASGLDDVARLCASGPGALIARPVRAEDDRSVAWRDTCGCDLCTTFGEFLSDASRRTLEWPLAEARRKHITQSARAAELPVRHQVLRAGSPHTLILTKTDALFERERKTRQRAITDLAWLSENWPATGYSKRSKRDGQHSARR